MTGRFVVLEGLDGAGITTQGRRLRDWLGNELGRRAVHTQEPSDGPVGALIRQVLRHRIDADPATLALLFAADRLDHLATEVEPRLNTGIVVVCDRYYLSSLAYQTSEVSDPDWLAAINRRARRPDLTIFLDVPPTICVERMAIARHEVQRFEKVETLTRVRANFLHYIAALRAEGDRVEILDGRRPINDVHADVRALVESILAPA